MVDYVLAASVAVLVASSTILGAFLVRYARLVREVDKSTRLAKDLWESMSARFSVIDTRLIDVMAKSEVITSRMLGAQANMAPRPSPDVRGEVGRPAALVQEVPSIASSPPASPGETTDTEVRVLQMLFQGPLSSAQIKEALGRSREHTARLMKGLFERGLVVRNDRNKPYVYEITQAGKSYVAS